MVAYGDTERSLLVCVCVCESPEEFVCVSLRQSTNRSNHGAGLQDHSLAKSWCLSSKAVVLLAFARHWCCCETDSVWGVLHMYCMSLTLEGKSSTCGVFSCFQWKHNVKSDLDVCQISFPPVLTGCWSRVCSTGEPPKNRCVFPRIREPPQSQVLNTSHLSQQCQTQQACSVCVKSFSLSCWSTLLFYRWSFIFISCFKCD